MKIKTLIGYSAFAVLIVLAFCGLVYQKEGDVVVALLWTLVWAVSGGLTLLLADKGISTQTAHSKAWNVLGWISAAIYVVLICYGTLIPIAHFFKVRANSAEIQTAANDKITYLTEEFANYDQQVEKRAMQLTDDLGDEIRRHNYSNLRSAYTVYPTAWSYKWARTQGETLKNELQKNVHPFEDFWVNEQKDYYAQLFNRFGMFTVAPAAFQLDTIYEQYTKLMMDDYQSIKDPYEQYIGSKATYSLKTSPKPSPVIDYFTGDDTSAVGWVVAILLFVLSCFPFVFVRLDRVSTKNSRFKDVYSQGYAVDKLLQ